MAKKWIGAMHMKKGALTSMAKKAGKSISSYCAQGNLSAKAQKRCNLAKTLRRMK